MIEAEDLRAYYLKRIGPWRNLPLADEARVLSSLANQGMNVAEYIPTDIARLYAGRVEDSFVLMPKLPAAEFSPREVLAAEAEIGRLVGLLHRNLARYPWPTNSSTEDLIGSLKRDLMLPEEVSVLFEDRRAEMIDAVEGLTTQLVHGDFTPENIILREPIQLSGFIDFDHLPLAPRMWDVAKYLSRRLRTRWLQDDFSANYPRARRIREFLPGYHSANPISSRELEALPSLIATANVIEVSYFMEIARGTLQRRQLSDHDEVLADSIEAAGWQLSHWEDVVDAVAV